MRKKIGRRTDASAFTSLTGSPKLGRQNWVAKTGADDRPARKSCIARACRTFQTSRHLHTAISLYPCPEGNSEIPREPLFRSNHHPAPDDRLPTDLQPPAPATGRTRLRPCHYIGRSASQPDRICGAPTMREARLMGLSGARLEKLQRLKACRG